MLASTMQTLGFGFQKSRKTLKSSAAYMGMIDAFFWEKDFAGGSDHPAGKVTHTHMEFLVDSHTINHFLVAPDEIDQAAFEEWLPGKWYS